MDFNGNLQRALFEAIHVARLGLKVDFAVSSEAVRTGILAKSVPDKYRNTDGFRVCPLAPIFGSGKIGWRINNLLALPAGAVKHICGRDDVLMHVHAPSPVTKPFSLSLIKNVVNAPMLVDLHDSWSGNPFSKSPLLFLQTKIMKYVLDRADFVVAAHSALVDLVKRISMHKRVELVPNGVDTNVFRPMPRNLSLLKRLDLSLQDQILVFSGHMTEEKGLDVLAFAAKKIIEKNKNVRFMLIGDGPIRGQIMDVIGRLGLTRFFRLTGFVGTEDLSNYISLADVCVCPYKPLAHYSVMKIETPMKVVQYMSMAKPVIMSRVSSENVVNWSNGGILIDPGNPEKLAEALLDLLHDESSRKAMGERGRKYVEDNLDWSVIAKKLVAIYHSL